MQTSGYIQLYPLVRCVLMLVLGILVGCGLEGIVPLWCWLLGFIASVVLCFLLKPVMGQCVSLWLSVCMFGIILYQLHAQHKPSIVTNEYVSYRAVVAGMPMVRGKVVRCDLWVETPKGFVSVTANVFRDTVQHRWKQLQVGSCLQAVSVMERKYGRKLYTFIYYTDWNLLSEHALGLSYFQHLQLRMRVFRNRLLNNWQQKGLENDELAVLAAMTLGDKQWLTKQLKKDYNRSSTSHILALSGLHLAILYGILLFLLPKYGRLRYLRLLVIPVIWGYVVLVGMPSSVVRAALMLSVYTCVSLNSGHYLSLNSLAFAACVMLVANPDVLWEVGFQLSFMAVVGIWLFSSTIEKHLPNRLMRFRAAKFVGSMLSVTMSAQLGVLPLLLLYFGRFSCYFLLSNLLVVPLATLILYITPLFAVLPWGSEVIAQVLSTLIKLLNSVVGWVASLPGASVEWQINGWQAGLLYVFLGCLCGLYGYLKPNDGMAKY